MRIDPANRVIEVGHVMYTPAMQRTARATEAQYLFAKYVFDALGNRRYEWKCDNLNTPSKRAAGRFGLTFEGVFRQHMIVKGRNRDTAWFAMLDGEWPARKAAYERWLSPDNFDADGRQRQSAFRTHAGRPLLAITGETPMSWPDAVTLTGEFARLEPLSQDHCAGLIDAVEGRRALAALVHDRFPRRNTWRRRSNGG